jgi:hypothetical protein
MRRYVFRVITVPLLMALVVAVTAGVSEAKAKGAATPTIKSAVGSASVSVGSTVSDTVTVTGKAKYGAPTGTVTINACGPTSSATPCTAPNPGSSTVSLSPGTKNHSTAIADLTPTSAGWYCFLDDYNGDTHYRPVSDNNAKTECFDASGSSTGPITPTLKSVFSSSSIPLGSTDMDTATVTGNAAGGSPTGTVTFSACGPTTSATPCTSPNAGSATADVSQGPNDTSTAGATLVPNTTGWYCFLDQYSGDGNYNAVSDNNAATECVDVTGSSSHPTTPTLKSVLSSSSVPFGSSAVDTATVTGSAADGSPTGTLTFSACGPTAAAAACTSPNVGPNTEEVSPESGDRAVASVTINPGAPGWYCFLDQYSGDGNYNAVTDNDTATECLDVTGSSATADGSARSTVITTG